MKTKLLFICYSMKIGGDISSLITLLHTIDYSAYEVDLLMLKNEGDLLNDIPKEVNILPQAINNKNPLLLKLKKALVYILKGYMFKRLMYSYFGDKRYIKGQTQIMAYAQNDVCRKIKKQYDVSIGYMEFWPNAYSALKTNSKKRIGWIHVDYENAGLDPQLDKKTFYKFDKIACVSDKCLSNFRNLFPELSSRSSFIDNITSETYIKKKSEEIIYDFEKSSDYLIIITVARLSNAHKGLDRAVMALKKLKDDGYKVKWFVIGDGSDKSILEKMIEKNDLKEHFILLGKRINPYPYIKKADLYVMTSRYEGKPIAVTEAQILGVPIVTTAYQSANEQVINGFDGIVVENNDESIYYGIKELLDNPQKITEFKENLLKRKFSNEYVVDDFYKLIKGK